MISGEQFKAPVGHIDMILHKGGEYDIKTGTIKNGAVIAKKEVKNLIVDNASKLMACRMAPDRDIDNPGLTLNKGLQYLAVGAGELQKPGEAYHPTDNKPRWDLLSPPSEMDIGHNLVKLHGEIYRKQFTSWCYVEDNADITETNKISNVLKLVTTFMEDEAVGPLMEMGLFGGDATNGPNTGYLFNYKTFPVWNKPRDARLTITWKLTF